jgi:predicted N-acetyltransferase YhbS
MNFTTQYVDRQQEVIDLFATTFTASEGAAEGTLIGSMVTTMLSKTAEEDLFAFLAVSDTGVQAAALFTRMTYADDARSVFILSPMAVSPDQQGKGVGQSLLRFALSHLRGNGVDVALTYGDINFYSRVGFAQIYEDTARAPLPLSYPHGWLGQSLRVGPLEPLKGAASCVSALRDPSLW